MRPIRLEVEGFTSFRTLQEIDFTELDLFVITGPTGSGKSSILDALSLALYGKVPRTNDHELRELISLGASQAKVLLDFEVDRTRYRVARRLPRKGAQKATVERVEGDAAVSEVEGSGVREANARVVEIVGLDYDAFTRAVLLPQGAFSEFLKGDKNARSRILITLLDLDRFVRVGKRANEEAKRLSYEVQSKDDLLEREYGDVDEETLEAAGAEAEAASKRLEVVDGAVRSAKSHLAARQVACQRLDRIEEVEEGLEGQTRALGGLRDAWKALSGRDEKTRAEVERMLHVLQGAETKRNEARGALEELIAEIGTEGDIAGLEEAANALQAAGASIDREEKSIAETESHRDDVTSRRKGLSRELGKSEKANAKAADALASASEALKVAEETLRTAKDAATLTQERSGAAKKIEELEGALSKAKEENTASGDVLTAARERLRGLETEHAAAALRAHVHSGDDCPVCGATIEDLPPTDPETEAALEEAREAVEAAERAAAQAGQRVAAIESRLSDAHENLEQLDAKLESFADAPAISAAERWVDKASRAEAGSREELEKASEQLKSLTANLAAVDAEQAGLEATLAASRSALEQAKGRSGRARERLEGGLGKPLPEDPGEVIRERRARLREAASAKEGAEQAFEQAREAHERATAARSAFESEVTRLREQVRSQRALLDDRGGALEKLGSKPQFPSPEPDEHDLSGELAAVATRADTLAEAAAALATGVKEEIAGVDREILDAVRGAGVATEGIAANEAVGQLESAARREQRLADQAANNAETLQKRLATKKEMLAEVAEQRQRMLLYRKLGRELHRDQFVAFLLDESFRDLAVRASNELQKISDGRYSLAADGDSFVVIDHVNADERRSVVTLSGGETFMASLALALALAQGITDIAGHSAATRLESMFIDEGFGSLDPTALDLAVEALERLREGERMIGVITHVAALAERIPAGIDVSLKGGGSRVVVR